MSAPPRPPRACTHLYVSTAPRPKKNQNKTKYLSPPVFAFSQRTFLELALSFSLGPICLFQASWSGSFYRILVSLSHPTVGVWAPSRPISCFDGIRVSRIAW